MKKAIGMFAALILALGMSGIAYATWSETLVISGTVNTGDVDVEWSEGKSWDTEDPEKDVSRIECVIEGNLLRVTVYNAYPCIDYYNVVDIHCVGIVPVHLYEIVAPDTDPSVEVDITYWLDLECTNEATLPVQLHQCERIYAKIHVHITNAATEGYTYNFDAQIDAVQWNMTWPEPLAP